MRFLLLLSMLGILLTGCTAPAAATNPPGDETAAARKLYISKCAKCHKFYDPAKYSDAEWVKWMAKMSKKSKLNPEQQEILSRYIDTTFRSDPAHRPERAP